MDIPRIAELANIKLVPGVALVIVGARESGKTTFAEIIAAKHGTYTTCRSRFDISQANVRVNTIIFDDCSEQFIKSDESKFQITTVAKNFIFTTSTAPVIDPDCRRFHVVHI